MFPTPAQVKHAALARSRRRGKLVLVPEDFDEARAALFLEMNYRPVLGYRLGGTKRRLLGRKQPRRCRYCLKTRPETTFAQVAHTIPECLGNRTLISLDECDQCNQRFSQTFEDDFDKFTQPMRTMMGVRGKNGVPVFKSRDGKGRVQLDPTRKHFTIEEQGMAAILSDDEANKTLELTLKGRPYVPLEVYRCLVKMAFGVLPDEELEPFDLTRRCLVEPPGPPPPAVASLAAVHLGFVPGKFPDPFISLWRRSQRGIPAPYMLSTLGACGLIFMYALPLSSEDDHLIPGRSFLPRFDFACHPGTLNNSWRTIDLRSTVPEPSPAHRYWLTYESSQDDSGQESGQSATDRPAAH
jgi:HNH endonuclease